MKNLLDAVCQRAGDKCEGNGEIEVGTELFPADFGFEPKNCEEADGVAKNNEEGESAGSGKFGDLDEGECLRMIKGEARRVPAKP